jgi:hypothetical protein
MIDFTELLQSSPDSPRRVKQGFSFRLDVLLNQRLLLLVHQHLPTNV